MSLCGLTQLDGDRICLLPAGHDRGNPDDTHSDGEVSWRHHEVEVGSGLDGEPVYDVWDDVVEA